MLIVLSFQTGAVTEKVGNKTGSQVTESECAFLACFVRIQVNASNYCLLLTAIAATGKALSAVGSLRSKKDTQPIEPKVEKRRLIYSIPRTVTLPKKKYLSL